MSREPIKDRNFRTIGYIESTPDGKRKAIDSNFRILGYYNPNRSVTLDTNFRVIANGDVLSGLIYDKR
jgi:hypothetical protein